MWAEYGLDGVDAIRIVISCIVFYVGILLFVRLLGQRALTNLSSFDLAAVIAWGALIGRAILGDSPTLISGLLGLATLLALQALTGNLRRFRRAAQAVNSPAVVLMAGQELLPDNLARTHIQADEVYSRLRLAGIRNRAEVGCVILEPTGQISVLRHGAPLDEALLDGVVGAERIPDRLRRGHEGR